MEPLYVGSRRGLSNLKGALLARLIRRYNTTSQNLHASLHLRNLLDCLGRYTQAFCLSCCKFSVAALQVPAGGADFSYPQLLTTSKIKVKASATSVQQLRLTLCNHCTRVLDEERNEEGNSGFTVRAKKWMTTSL